MIKGYKAVIQECINHFNMYTAQCKEFDRLEEEAKCDLLQVLSLHLRMLLPVIDLGQNTGTPNLRGNQFGDFYYMIPITHLLFGIASPVEEFMNTCSWEELVTNRQADRIVLCLYLDLVC